MQIENDLIQLINFITDRFYGQELDERQLRLALHDWQAKFFKETP